MTLVCHVGYTPLHSPGLWSAYNKMGVWSKQTTYWVVKDQVRFEVLQADFGALLWVGGVRVHVEAAVHGGLGEYILFCNDKFCQYLARQIFKLAIIWDKFF